MNLAQEDSYSNSIPYILITDWLLTSIPTANISAQTQTRGRTAARIDNTTIYISKAQIWCLDNTCLRQVWCSCPAGSEQPQLLVFGSWFLDALRGGAVSTGCVPPPRKKGKPSDTTSWMLEEETMTQLSSC